MKNNGIRFIAVFLCVLVLVLTSCSTLSQKKVPDHPQKRVQSNCYVTEQYLYFKENFFSDGIKYVRIVRMNFDTGEVSVPCADPVCAHNDENCYLVVADAHVDPIMVFDDLIYYSADIHGSLKREIRRVLYDMSSNMGQQIFADAGDISESGASECVVSIGKYLYHVGYVSEKNEETGKYDNFSALQRYDTKTGKQENIATFSDIIHISVARDARVYLLKQADDGTQSVFSVNKNGKDYREEPNFVPIFPWYTHNNNVYYHDENKTVWVNDLETGANEQIIDTTIAGLFFMTDEYIYYLMMDKAIQDSVKSENIPRNEKGGIDREAYMQILENYHSAPREIWRCDHNGENLQMIGELAGVDNQVIDIHDDYIYIMREIVEYDPDALTKERQYYELWRIDMNTWQTEQLPRSSEQ